MQAWMFPGQGAQHVGMGLDLLARFPRERDCAEDILGLRLAELYADAARLRDTRFTQPAVFVASHLAALALREDGVPEPDLVLGHSLGLYAALTVAGVLSFPVATKLVDERARCMKAVGEGAMLAVIGSGVGAVGDELLRLDLTGIDIANDNAPDQIVLSGPPDEIERAAGALAGGDRRCVMLGVSGAFHSRYQEPARLAFTRAVLDAPLSPAGLPVVSTTSGGVVPDTHMVEELTFQLVRPVRWRQTVERLLRVHPGLAFREVGPGQVLTGLVEKIRRARPAPRETGRAGSGARA